jgi:hypothetical protein
VQQKSSAWIFLSPSPKAISIRTAGIIIPVIRNFLVFVHMRFFCTFHYFNDFWQMSVKQRYQYLWLIWRKTWINVNDFFKSSESRTEVKASVGWLPMFPRRPVGTVGDWCWCKDHVCKFEYWCLNMFLLMCVLYSHKLSYSLKLCACKEKLTVYVSKHLETVLKYADCDVRKRMSNCCL